MNLPKWLYSHITWCEKTVFLFLLGVYLFNMEAFFTLPFWKESGIQVLKAVAILWLVLRCVDVLYCLPARRAAKRHLDELEKQKFGKYWKPR